MNIVALRNRVALARLISAEFEESVILPVESLLDEADEALDRREPGRAELIYRRAESLLTELEHAVGDDVRGRIRELRKEWNESANERS